ncbi:uncharacterized protein LOC121386525 [Gigantopelta aegis]|uniref:uncharacterized protein LOC121386525 n=1 Tax=Gigantopelta aegis TaxID=1735272 RepID=UPI001B88BB4D|nr:uncharacterized protein LOC121386525 [Gigantopelta aegis]
MTNWSQLLMLMYINGCYLSSVTVDGAQLTVTQGADTMTVTCRPGTSVSQIDSYSVITLLRDVGNSRFTRAPVAMAAPSKNNGQAILTDTSLTLRATVTGKADNNDKRGSFVQIVLRKISCSDSGQYFCRINYLTVDVEPGSSEDSRNITVQTDPGPVSMFVTPWKEASPYFVNETVEFQCTGDVGNPPQTRQWSWQWQYADGMMDLWRSYPYNDRITDDPVTTANCTNQGRSTVRHVASVDDNGRMFRCLVNNNELYSANFTIYTETDTTVPSGGVTSKAVTTVGPGVVTCEVCRPQTDSLLGTGIGIGVGISVLTGLVVGAVIFVFFRIRKVKGENEHQYASRQENAGVQESATYDDLRQDHGGQPNTGASEPSTYTTLEARVNDTPYSGLTVYHNVN